MLLHLWQMATHKAALQVPLNCVCCHFVLEVLQLPPPSTFTSTSTSLLPSPSLVETHKVAMQGKTSSGHWVHCLSGGPQWTVWSALFCSVCTALGLGVCLPEIECVLYECICNHCLCCQLMSLSLCVCERVCVIQFWCLLHCVWVSEMNLAQG